MSVCMHESVSMLREKLGIRSIGCGVHGRQPHWVWSLKRTAESRVKKCLSLTGKGTCGRGRPRKTGDKVVKQDF